ncbi:hypothetical protein [Pseudomonas sp. S2_C03]
MKKETSRKSPQGGRAAEAGFELRYQNAARLKAGAHYTGIRSEWEDYLSEN